MIPILYDKTETSFTTNGLGRLTDALSCEVTEERNGSFELELTYPVDGIHYSDIAYGKIIYAEPAEGEAPQPFEIYLITKPLNQIVTVHAEHISYRLKYIPTTKFEAHGVKDALNQLKSHSVIPCPFNIWTDKNAPGLFIVEDANSIRSFLTDGDDTITSVFGGEWKFDKFDAKLCKSRGNDNGVTIRYGKNLTSLEQEENIENMVTGIYPYWQDDDNYLDLPEKVVNTSAAGLFPYQRVIAVDFSSNIEGQEITHNWTETSQEVDPSTSRIHTNTEEKSETIKVAPSAESLRNQARIYIQENDLNTPEVNLKVSFANLAKSLEYKDIAELERVHLCDIVTVQFLKLGVSTKAKVTKTVYDVLNEKYTSIEVGNPKEDLSSSFRKIEKKADDAQKSADIAQTSANTAQTSADNAQTSANDANANANNVRKDLTDTCNSLDIKISDQAKAASAMNIRITANENGLTTKVSKDGVISSINQTEEKVQIDASKINLNGYLTVTDVGKTGSTVIDGARIDTGTITADKLAAGAVAAHVLTAQNGDAVITTGEDDYGNPTCNISGGVLTISSLDTTINNDLDVKGDFFLSNIPHGEKTYDFVRVDRSTGQLYYTETTATA